MSRKDDLVADVLIAIEDALTRSQASQSLRTSSGVRSISANNADDLINRLKSERYDALVLSESFFGLAYRGLVSLIRSGDLCPPNLPIVLVLNGESVGADEVAKRYFVRATTESAFASICNEISAAISDRPRPTALVIDDNDHFLKLVGEHLDVGFHVVALSRPQDAEATFRSVRPDIVVCDYAMPFRDGEAVARELRALDEDVPIVILTAHNTPENHIKLIKAGITRFVPKTTPFRELERILRDLVLERAMTRASKSAAPPRDAVDRLVRAIHGARDDLNVGRPSFAAERLKAALMRNVGPATDDYRVPEEKT